MKIILEIPPIVVHNIYETMDLTNAILVDDAPTILTPDNTYDRDKDFDRYVVDQLIGKALDSEIEEYHKRFKDRDK